METNGEDDLVLKKYNASVYRFLTTFDLLDCPEPLILIKALANIDTYITKHSMEIMPDLLNLGLYDILYTMLDKPLGVVKMALKLLMRIFHYRDKDEIISEFEHDPSYINILCDLAVNTFSDSMNEFAVETVTHILSYFCETPITSTLLIRSDLIKTMFEYMTVCSHRQCFSNCLEVVHNTFYKMRHLKVLLIIIRHPLIRQREYLIECEEIDISVLNCLLKGPCTDFREIVVKMFHIITMWELHPIHDEMYFEDTIPCLITVLTEAKWTEVQNNVLEIIYTYNDLIDCRIQVVESSEFSDFIQFAKTATPAHGLGCVALIIFFAKLYEAKQILIDIGIERQLVYFFELDCDLLRVKLCEAIEEMCTNCYVIDGMVVHDLLRHLGITINKSYLPWNPYRQSSIKPLHIFLSYSPKYSMMFYKADVLRHVRDALVEREYLDEKCFLMILDIFQLLCTNKYLLKHLIIRPTFNFFFKLLDDENDEMVTKAIYFIEDSFLLRYCRIWFVKNKGVAKIMAMITDQKCRHFKKLIGFLKIVAKYKRLSFHFLFAGVVNTLLTLHKKTGNVKLGVLINHIIQTLYSHDLSIKFHDTYHLSIHDITKNGFCVYSGSSPGLYPYVSTEFFEKLDSSFTIFVANFLDNRKCENELKSAINLETSFGYIVPTLEIYNCKYYDPRLIKYVRIIVPLLQQEKHLIFKINKLAKFVYIQLTSGRIKNRTELIFPQYETQITEIKVRNKTNYVPIGAVHLGSMTECAMLFKILADRVGIPCTLNRNVHDRIWNTIPIFAHSENPKNDKYKPNSVLIHHVVDLMDNIGQVFPVGSAKANIYCYGMSKAMNLAENELPKTEFPSISTFTVPSDVQ